MMTTELQVVCACTSDCERYTRTSFTRTNNPYCDKYVLVLVSM